MALENITPENVANHAYLGVDSNTLHVVSHLEMQTRVHYHEYNLETGECLTEWRSPISALKEKCSRIAEQSDFASVIRTSPLYNALQQRNLIHEALPNELTGAD